MKLCCHPDSGTEFQVHVWQQRSLAGIMQEGLRMSAGSGIIWRILERDAVVGGHAIPRGATVVAPIACIHHDAKHWPEPERFLPARFLEGMTHQHPIMALTAADDD